MSLQLKSLTNGTPIKDTGLPAPNSLFNVIPTANDVYDLYTAPKTSTTNRAAIVKGVRLSNTRVGTSSVKVTLYFTRPNATGQHQRRLLAPADLLLADGFTYVDDSEITLEPGDKI